MKTMRIPWAGLLRRPAARASALLDQVMPQYEIASHHSVIVRAPAAQGIAGRQHGQGESNPCLVGFKPAADDQRRPFGAVFIAKRGVAGDQYRRRSAVRLHKGSRPFQVGNGVRHPLLAETQTGGDAVRVVIFPVKTKGDFNFDRGFVVPALKSEIFRPPGVGFGESRIERQRPVDSRRPVGIVSPETEPQI